MQEYYLVDSNSNLKQVGDKVTDFRGDTATIKAIHTPKHSGSSGHVTTEDGFFYAGVYDLHFVPVHSVLVHPKPSSHAKF